MRSKVYPFGQLPTIKVMRNWVCLKAAVDADDNND